MKPHPSAGTSVTVVAIQVFQEEICSINTNIIKEFINLKDVKVL